MSCVCNRTVYRWMGSSRVAYDFGLHGNALFVFVTYIYVYVLSPGRFVIGTRAPIPSSVPVPSPIAVTQ